MNTAQARPSLPPPPASRDAQRGLQALLLLLLALAGGAALVLIATLTDRCGDGACGNGETCALDCRPAATLALAPTPAPTPAPALAPTPAPALAPTPAPAPTPALAPAPAPAPAPTPTPTALDEGRCAEPAFKALARSLVKDCERACKKDESPLVGLSSEDFGELFGRPDDAGVATHFALFGCNTWARDNGTCRGFDSSIADPSACPPGAATCPADARALQSELLAFLAANRDAHTILLFGTASKAGNQPTSMSDDNARLAEDRAHAVAEVVHGWRRKVGARDMRVLSVALDNTRTDYWETASFRAVIAAQVGKVPGNGTSVGRSFSPLSADAVNRSVMVVALKCPSLK